MAAFLASPFGFALLAVLAFLSLLGPVARLNAAVSPRWRLFLDYVAAIALGLAVGLQLTAALRR